MSTKLSVNINKIALLRNARGGMVPDLLQFAKDCAAFGADGITVHPRQDERHITRRDVRDLAQIFPSSNCEFNIEGYPSLDFVRLVLDAKPSQVTLVPDTVNQLTSDHGWDVKANFKLLKEVLYEFHLAGIRSSLFIEADPIQLEAAKEVGADRIEFYTGPYAEAYYDARRHMQDVNKTVEKFKSVLSLIEELELGINAGHDLNLDNLKFFKANIPNLLEVSIGQALVRDCLYYGLENTIQMYKRELA
ncbi:MAG: pyridoxine 5'-phosphate synthase [Chitinophagales bacterium]|nr:pyridoxine 5'-phosphate synthase [Chitinophagales bacterium]